MLLGLFQVILHGAISDNKISECLLASTVTDGGAFLSLILLDRNPGTKSIKLWCNGSILGLCLYLTITAMLIIVVVQKNWSQKYFIQLWSVW